MGSITPSLILLVSALAHAEPSSSWPMFRGNLQMTGIATETLPDNIDLIWSKKIDDSFESTAAVAEGVLYVPSLLAGKCYALALADGKDIWTFSSPDQDPSKSSPCLAEDLIVFGDDVGNVRALRRSDGKEAWKFAAEGEIVCSPTYIGGKILIGGYDNYLYSLEAKTGKLEWKIETGGPVHCSPTFIDGQVAVAGCDGFLHFVSVADGKETGSLEIGGQIASTPALTGTHLFFGTMTDSVIGVDWKSKAIEWVFKVPNRAFPFYSSPVIAGDLVVIGGRDKALHAIEQATGKQRWQFQAKARIDSSPVLSGSRIFFGSHDGYLYAVDAKSGEKVWEYLLGGEIVASPAIAQGRLVIASTTGEIFCFGTK